LYFLYFIFKSQHENVDDDGNYNIQVLSEALKLFGAEIQPLRGSEAIKLLEINMDDIEAFIFNSSTHWFAIRKLENVWYNLNSTNSFPGPEIISDFYLSAFIQGTEDIGFTNFLVSKLPILPDVQSDFYKNLQNYQRLVNVDEILKAKESKKNNNKKDSEKEEKKENENKFNAFCGNGIKLNQEDNNNSNNELFEDDEFKKAYQLSLEEYILDLNKNLPAEPSDDDFFNIIFKNGNQTFSRKFSSDNKIKVIKILTIGFN